MTDSHLSYATEELLRAFMYNKYDGHDHWQTFGAATGIGYLYPAVWYDRNKFTNIEVRFR